MKKPKFAFIAAAFLGIAALVITGIFIGTSAARKAKEGPKIETLLEKSGPLSATEQEDLAKEIFAKLAASAAGVEPEFFERHYKIVMDKCPDTRRAHESYWRLTNLYTQAYGEPKNEEIVKILEQFLARYKTSTVVSMKKYPDEMLVFSPIMSLHQAYEDLGRHDQITAYYDKIADPEASFAVYDYFDYAGALEKTGRIKDAVIWYEKFLKKTEGDEDVGFIREMAQDRIKELKIK